MNDIYHYIECGLPNIYLRNGYHIEVIDDEEYFSIDDIGGLHKVIALALVNKTTHLTGDEFKFFRLQFNHSRRVLAELLGYDQQTIGRWENGNSSIPKLADASIRKLYLESVNEDSNLGLLLEQIADIEAELEMRKIVIEETEDHWEVAKG
ncbi:helix-turn-helix domain-containing protein [Vibrio sp. JC009]|uniref:helix-turn-helix domain-containing protein n=1 Tax=Vibrio sp. JC009 TaxID=2912314 RepID=UPI0023AF4E66|nr:helix-turn-helix domain-containing protein [Vibrio sp. JC009]WED21826.1 helix-turn-helix domain-containing protein [Vibrio sp. JC009]